MGLNDVPHVDSALIHVFSIEMRGLVKLEGQRVSEWFGQVDLRVSTFELQVM